MIQPEFDFNKPQAALVYQHKVWVPVARLAPYVFKPGSTTPTAKPDTDTAPGTVVAADKGGVTIAEAARRVGTGFRKLLTRLQDWHFIRPAPDGGYLPTDKMRPSQYRVVTVEYLTREGSRKKSYLRLTPEGVALCRQLTEEAG